MSMLQSSQRAKFEPLRSLAFGSIGATYTLLGTVFVNPARMLKMTNLTDGDLLVSFDGVSDYDVCPAGGFWLYDYCSNMATQGGILEQPAVTQVYVKYTGLAPTVKSVYLTLVYASMQN